MQYFDLELADDYSLIGIHTSEEDYKLAYLLNLNLNTRFTKSKIDLDFNNSDALFPVFEYRDKKNQISNYLISNKYLESNTKVVTSTLFSDEVFLSSTSYLISEKKKVDYFLKIEGDISQNSLEKIIKGINNIKQVITSYKINPSSLKSKDFLIF